MNRLVFFFALCIMGMNNMYAQFSSSAQAAYEQSKRALNSSSFSLANTHASAPTSGTVRFTNGSVFSGQLLNGQPLSGVLEETDGTKHHCYMSNNMITGWCFTEYTDGSWYYGIWSNGRKHGEGSYYDGEGNYFDMVYNNGTRTSIISVSTPKHSKEEFYDIERQKAQIVIDAQNELGNSYYQSGSNSSTRSSYSSSSRTCGVCHGTGKCNTCNGRGWYTSIGIGSGRHLCSSCNHTGRCQSCRGTGKQ